MDFFYENNKLFEMIRDFIRLKNVYFSNKQTKRSFHEVFSVLSLANNLAASIAICAASARRSSPSFWDKDRRCCGDNLRDRWLGWRVGKKVDFFQISRISFVIPTGRSRRISRMSL